MKPFVKLLLTRSFMTKMDSILPEKENGLGVGFNNILTVNNRRGMTRRGAFTGLRNKS